ncbi:MAG TPA: hypothetical protein VM778_05865 [Gemmatimonadota bacterium]|nr:hypothetical protein [Gemmatimonadota bacterium]
MVPLASLWVPILVSAALVFLASALLHMVLTYHRSDFGSIQGEDRVMALFREVGVGAGEYMMPHAASPAETKDPAFIAKREKGPVAVITVFKGGASMGTSLAQWFVYCLVVSVFAAYLASRAVAPGAEYLEVFRFAGTTAFAGYALALWQNSIWYKRPWSTTIKQNFDGLVYALLTAGVFGWLWPAA